MPGIITDLIDRVSDSSAGRPVIATLAAPGKAIGAASINLDAATNWTTSSAIHFSIYETTTVGSTVIKNASTQTDWKGTLSGVAIGNLTLTGGTDRAYTAGAKVEITPTARYAKDLYDWAMTGHNQNGTHKAFTEASIVPTASIQDLAVTGAKIADTTITNAKLATSAGEIGAAWQTWTPTLTGITEGNGTKTAKYLRIGKIVFYRMSFVLGTTSAVSGCTMSLPVTAASIQGGTPIGNSTYYDVSAAADYTGTVLMSGGAADFRVSVVNGTFARQDGVTSTNPTSGWATGDIITAQGFYETT